MKRSALLLASMALAVLLASGVVRAQQTTPPASDRSPAAGEPIPGRYIVLLEEGTQEEKVGSDPTLVALDHARHHGAEVLYAYRHAVRGYAARIPDRRLEEVRPVAVSRTSSPTGRYTQRLRGCPGVLTG